MTTPKPQEPIDLHDSVAGEEDPGASLDVDAEDGAAHRPPPDQASERGKTTMKEDKSSPDAGVPPRDRTGR
jgi:hypothetical protein